MHNQIALSLVQLLARMSVSRNSFVFEPCFIQTILKNNHDYSICTCTKFDKIYLGSQHSPMHLNLIPVYYTSKLNLETSKLF